MNFQLVYLTIQANLMNRRLFVWCFCGFDDISNTAVLSIDNETFIMNIIQVICIFWVWGLWGWAVIRILWILCCYFIVVIIAATILQYLFWTYCFLSKHKFSKALKCVWPEIFLRTYCCLYSKEIFQSNKDNLKRKTYLWGMLKHWCYI